MVYNFHLDTFVKQGVDYRTRARQCLIIQKIGTDTTSVTDPAYLFIDNKKVGPIIQDIAGLHKVSARWLDLLSLGPLYYVIPPKTDFTVKGESAKLIRVKGIYAELAVGEEMPSDWRARFERQHKHYYTFLYKYADWSAGKTFAAWSDELIGEITPLTKERYNFHGLASAKLVGWTKADNAVGIRFRIMNAGLEELLDVPSQSVIDITSMPYPPSVGSAPENAQPFSLADYPIEVKGDETFRIYARNNTSSAITIDEASGNGPYFLALAEYEKLE